MKLTLEQKALLIEFVAKSGIATGMTCARELNVNWHECSSYLDELNTKGIVKVVGHNNDGMTKYSLNK